jgi:hypothetical protein
VYLRNGDLIIQAREALKQMIDEKFERSKTTEDISKDFKAAFEKLTTRFTTKFQSKKGSRR